MTAPAPEIVPVLCPRCRTEVATITDGPRVTVVYVGETGEQGGDNCARCPNPDCRARVCWRVVVLCRAA